MRKVNRAAVAAAIIVGVSFIGTSTSTAHAAQHMGGGGCRSHDLNIDILGEVGILNGLGGNLLNGEGSPGAQVTDFSDCDGGW
ncbi:hypothetical protein ACF073_21880 [Streptomyces sp. NPDC015171]|uniref:hypothetical protein n=1 Tax=Streptomyces sp. NPDC015171 TaxID=3364945 RepID=UPI0036F50BEA